MDLRHRVTLDEGEAIKVAEVVVAEGVVVAGEEGEVGKGAEERVGAEEVLGVDLGKIRIRLAKGIMIEREVTTRRWPRLGVLRRGIEIVTCHCNLNVCLPQSR
jgi:hypothetical protein